MNLALNVTSQYHIFRDWFSNKETLMKFTISKTNSSLILALWNFFTAFYLLMANNFLMIYLIIVEIWNVKRYIQHYSNKFGNYPQKAQPY